MKECYFSVIASFDLQFSKSNFPSWVFFRFLNSTNFAKSRKASLRRTFEPVEMFWLPQDKDIDAQISETLIRGRM